MDDDVDGWQHGKPGRVVGRPQLLFDVLDILAVPCGMICTAGDGGVARRTAALDGWWGCFGIVDKRMLHDVNCHAASDLCCSNAGGCEKNRIDGRLSAGLRAGPNTPPHARDGHNEVVCDTVQMLDLQSKWYSSAGLHAVHAVPRPDQEGHITWQQQVDLSLAHAVASALTLHHHHLTWLVGASAGVLRVHIHLVQPPSLTVVDRHKYIALHAASRATRHACARWRCIT